MTEYLKKILPPIVTAAIERLNFSLLYEIRMGVDRPCRVNYGGEFGYLTPCGVGSRERAIIIDVKQISDVLLRACDFSLYTVNASLCEGYLTVRGGIRIGVCGEAVYDADRLRTVKNYNAIDIRIPHEVRGCAESTYTKFFTRAIDNTLIVSPPCGGKTTFIRDLCRLISNDGHAVLLCDERCEIASAVCGRASLDVGRNTDIASGFKKTYTMRQGIRAMSPEVIITDELASEDVDDIRYCVKCGVKVIATAHAQDIEEVRSNALLSGLIDCGAFKNLIVLDGMTKQNGRTLFYGGGVWS